MKLYVRVVNEPEAWPTIPFLNIYVLCLWSGPEAIKLFFMLNSTEHEIQSAHKC